MMKSGIWRRSSSTAAAVRARCSGALYCWNLSWFSAFDCINNMNYACDRKFIEVYQCHNYQNITLGLTKLLQKTRPHSNLRPTIRECVHLLTRVTSDHVTKTAVTPFDSPMLHANLMALCFIESELWPMEFLHCGNRDFRLFCSCDLDLDPMTFIYELDPYSLEIHYMCKYELPTSRSSKIIF